MLIPFLSTHLAFAENPARDYKTFTFYLDNDVFNGSDREYTNGIKLSWISQDLSNYRADPRIPEWSYPIIEKLPFVTEPGFQRTISLSIGQNMYTPEDTDRTDLIKDDRPYAGVGYAGIGFHSKNQKRMDTLEVDLGIVGPLSYADKTQKTYHKWIDVKEPKGWDHQLNDELLLNFFYERKLKAIKTDLGHGFAYDLIPHAGCALGNALIGLKLGSQIRFGWHLPNDFGTFLIRPGSDTNAPLDGHDPRFHTWSSSLGIHIFADASAFYVLRDITLDGNTFEDSHSVDKEPLVGNFTAGLGVTIGRMKLSYAYAIRSKEFETQKENQKYGSITVSYSY